jgi:hypothetical protein
MATSGRFGAASAFVMASISEDVAQRSHLLRELGTVLLLALVDAHVFQQHDAAGRHAHAVDPVGHQRHVTAQQLRQAPGNGRQRILGLELALGRAAQVAGDHHGGASVQRHADARHRGTHAGVFGDVAGGVLRHVEVGADEHALAGYPVGGDEVGETDHFHGIDAVRG